MAAKRNTPSDFESSPLQPKHIRTEALADESLSTPVATTDVVGAVCCSSSYFVHSPLTVSSAGAFFSTVVSMSESSSISRQPVCSTELNPNSVKGLRSKVAKSRKIKLASLKLDFEILLKEKFFLDSGGNFMDFLSWKKKPNASRDDYLRQHDLEVPILNLSSNSNTTIIQIPLSTVSPTLHATPPKGPAHLSPTRNVILSSSPRPPTRAHASFSSVYENSHEDIVMRARHEAEVMKAISELRKEGLWCSSQLPKVHEPARIKTHWDYLLEEMQWLAADFANEKRWKVNAARKLSRSVAHYHRESYMQQTKSEKEDLVKLRKIASSIAKEVKYFWDSIRKIVEHKQHLLLEAKRRKAMDLHLEFIVDQTAKYSDWLAQGLGNVAGSSEPSVLSSSSPYDSDGFLSPPEESDDENTIEMEEKIQGEEGKIDYDDEVSQLLREGEMPLDELLASLSEGIVEEHGDSVGVESELGKQEFESPSTQTVFQSNEGKDDKSAVSDDDMYLLCSGEEFDEDESTIEEEELIEGEASHEEEMKVLEEEGKLSIQELLERYNLQREEPTPASVREGRIDQESQSGDDGDESTMSDIESFSGSESAVEGASEGDSTLETLIYGKSLEEACSTEAGLHDVAAAAEKFQPKGTTLATTDVKTAIPFLLRHKLREYQHIGLDWLVALHERKLNGILADEMGLGKTIQTIALLAHLVCERNIWGPHLIIVPTSVLLNWEYEIKKWCPALKILTYFGSFKERKQKRIGWSKRNAFHVCITSYNVAVTDHRAFKQKRWNYLILDEAQNIKNFKSQRWQILLNFNSHHRLLLTGTPLQNNLMELWSLMHFLMPSVFSSHSDFKEWFSNPLSGMVEGSQEYNDSIIKRLHQVLRPFLLRRLKMEVEKQMPQKYEHVVPCHLSKRQRFLYDEYMSRAKTKDSLATGNYLSVINILMQLRKVCNHPDLFEPRPIISSFQMKQLEIHVPSCALQALDYDPFKHVNLNDFNLMLCDYEVSMDAFASFRTRQLQASRLSFLDLSSSKGIEFEIDESTYCEHKSVANSFLEDLHIPDIDGKIQELSVSRCQCLYEVNSRRCRRSPVYGLDLFALVKKMSTHLVQECSSVQTTFGYWQWIGYSTCNNHCYSVSSGNFLLTCMAQVLPTLEDRVNRLEEIFERFVMVVPAATAPQVCLHSYHPHPSDLQKAREFDATFKREMLPCVDLLHPIATGSCFLFPERRLIQYDCGKLQTLDHLLQRLKIDDHRVLIFTQMSKMLDILEIFLNYRGLTYLRLDGSTPVQKRQYLMDRFNRDERVFCFILSTRSGGLGVNLTGADTVIFYDSDWNPTMDAQAQDRCHRIGQTRDVHIYRLICVSTVEENILKKANQKRMLGDIAIEGGVFTTDFFQQSSLRDLFEDKDLSLAEVRVDPVDTAPLSPKEVEELLLQAEDDRDAKAASHAKAEQLAEMAEFDEAFSVGNINAKVVYEDEETVKAMSEFSAIEEQLNGVEKYAVYFLEEETAEFAAEQLRVAEENIQQAKKEWELSHLQTLREEEEERIAEEGTLDDSLFTYDRPELSNKIYKDEETEDEMPMWLPPTPPSDDADECYVDAAVELKYDTQVHLSPAVLASIASFSEDDYDVFGLRRHFSDNVPTKKVSKISSKQFKEHVNVPPSLFWRRFTADTLSTKLKRLASHQKKMKSKDQFTPLLEQHPEGPEWSVNEDWILLKSINGVLEFPISLTISVPAQIPNWSIIADITSSVGRVRRSPLQCREHLMNVVIPREDGSVKGEEHSFESKKHKTKDAPIKKSKGRKEQRTKGLVLNNIREHTKQFSDCFDRVIQAGISRRETPKFTWDTVQKPSMHSDLLKDYGVNMESVQSPMMIAHQRAERIQSVRSFTGGHFAKPNSADVPKSGYNLPRQAIPPPHAGQQRPTSSSLSTFSPSKTTTSSVSGSTSVVTSTSQVHTSTVNTSLPATVNKTYTTASTGVGDLSKTLITRGLSSQQLLLLRQNTLQHQQAVTTASPAQSGQSVGGSQTQASAAVQQKISLPSGIEQLRATVASAASVLPRFAGVAATSSGTVKGLTGGRTLQTEEFLALLKQQSMRMAATQSAQLTSKPPQVSSYQASTKSAATPTGVVTTTAPTFKAQIQHKTVQARQSSDRK